MLMKIVRACDLPESLLQNSAEFINALVEDREPAIDVCESLAMTVPGIVVHQSALKNGEQLRVPRFDP